MDADAHRQSSVLVLRQTGIQRVHSLEDAQAGLHRALRIVFMGPGIPKVDQQTIAEILGDVPVKTLDHLRAGALIGAHHLAPLLGVELAGEHGGVHQVAKQHRELPALSLGRARLG
jgi:hypothetical protein